MKSIFLNGLNNVAPTELKKWSYNRSIMIMLLRSINSYWQTKSTSWFINFTS